MSIADAAHCAGCGRDLGLEPLGRAGRLECPECRMPLDTFEVGPGALHDCPACGGQFVDHAALRDLLERHERSGAVTPRRERSVEPVQYRPCPECAALMNRKNFGGASGVIVDVCKRHGTWFDAGELPRVLAFVEQGGMERARAREAEEAAQKKRDQIAQAIAQHPASSRDLGKSHHDGEILANAMTAVSELFSWLLK
jgi:Zn-finger nucleic acid-binding protein